MIIDYDVGWISAYEGEEEEHLSPLGIREDHWAFHGSIRHHFPSCHHQHVLGSMFRSHLMFSLADHKMLIGFSKRFSIIFLSSRFQVAFQV